VLKNAVQMRCWSRCVNYGVEDGMEDAGAMEARRNGGYGNDDVPMW